MEENTLSVYKEYISSLQDQLTVMNAKIDNLQSAMDICKDSISTLNTNIAESSNYMAMLITPGGVALVAIIMVVIGIIALKKGISFTKDGTTISIGGKRCNHEGGDDEGNNN